MDPERAGALIHGQSLKLARLWDLEEHTAVGQCDLEHMMRLGNKKCVGKVGTRTWQRARRAGDGGKQEQREEPPHHREALPCKERYESMQHYNASAVTPRQGCEEPMSMGMACHNVAFS
jgi:hypothetical protein